MSHKASGEWKKALHQQARAILNGQAVPLEHLSSEELKGLLQEIQAQYLALRTQNEQVQQEAQSKALLLEEVNHRVSNNLTALMALFEMEIANAAEGVEDFQTALRKAQGRVGSMAAMHHMLSTTAWHPLPLADLVRETIHAALKALPTQHAITVMLSLPIQQLVIAPKQAFTLALILNELVTNSGKYAFQSREQGHIQVTVAYLDGEEGQRLRLTYQDDGPGWPATVLQGESQNAGLQLVHRSVTYTLGGELTLQNDGGAVTTITFKLDRD